MIYSKGKYWKIRGKLGKYESLEAAQAAEAKLLAEERGEEPVSVPPPPMPKQIREPAENTPYENMIEKTVCKLCDLEPCECFIFTKKTEPGL